MNHFCILCDIKIKTIMLPREVYKLAKKFHKENNLIGRIPNTLDEAIYLDERNHITKDVTWMVRAVLAENQFEGMDEITIMISDIDKKVCYVLDHNGIPMYLK